MTEDLSLAKQEGGEGRGEGIKIFSSSMNFSLMHKNMIKFCFFAFWPELTTLSLVSGLPIPTSWR